MTPRFIGLIAIFVALVIDQGHKHWMIYSYDINALQPVPVGPWLDLVLVWNKGISYSWLQVHPLILLALMATAVLFLAIWMWRAGSWMTCLGLGLIIGGALGNAYDRWQYGAVADFFLFPYRYRALWTPVVVCFQPCGRRHRCRCGAFAV